MKLLLIILLAFISITSYSQQQVGSNGQLEPLGNYPVTSTQFIKGGQKTVPTLTDRDNIPMYLRDTGMLVYVTAMDSTYQLKGGLLNTNWISFKTGGKGNSKTILDTIQTTGQALQIAAYSGGGRVISLSTVGSNGSNFLPTYLTNGDSTYIYYDYAPNGQVTYKLTVIDASDTLKASGAEYTGSSNMTGTTSITGQDVKTALGYTPAASPVDYNSLINKPALKTVAVSGSYPDLINRPTLSTVSATGNYSDLIGKPTLSTVAGTGNYSDLIGKPTLSTVASSGSYTDLSNKPTIPAQLNLTYTQGVIISGTYPNLTAKLDTVYLNSYLGSHVVASSGSTGTVNSLAACYAVNTKFGLLSAKDSLETLQQYQLTQQTADSLSIPVIRQGLTKGSSTGYNSVVALLNSNREVQVNISLTPIDGSRNFTLPSERACVVTYLDTLFRNTLAPASGDTLIVASNEDGNKSYHILDTGTNLSTQSAYLYYQNELKPIDSIAKLYGKHFQTATGGVTGPVGWYFVWKNLIDSGRTTEANTVAAAVFPPGTNLSTYPTGANYGISIKYNTQLIPYIKASSVNYLNAHINLLTNGTDTSHINHTLMSLYVEAWKNLTGKDVITNELAATSTNPNIIAEEVVDCVKAGMKWVLLYDGTSRITDPTFAGKDVSFRNLGNSINNIGVTLRNTLRALKPF